MEDAQIFENATVNTCILSFLKNKKNTAALIVNEIYDLKSNFLDFIHKNSFYYSQNDFQTLTWNLLDVDKLKLGKKIKARHKTLEEYGTQINLGIATGANEVFVLDNDKYNDLIAKDAKNSAVIKNVLRGKDIKRYYYEKTELKIILAKNTVNIEQDYPVIYQYLDNAGDTFKNRGAQGKHWTNLRACSFFDDFQKEKIVWIELSDVNKFALCTEEIYLLNSAYFLIPPKQLSSQFLLGILNSKLIYFYLKLIANTSGMGTTRWINIYVKEFPIPEANDADKQAIEILVSRIIESKDKNPTANTLDLETQIDQLVYALYDLTKEEQLLIENCK
jgi:hypothetical protein